MKRRVARNSQWVGLLWGSGGVAPSRQRLMGVWGLSPSSRRRGSGGRKKNKRKKNHTKEKKRNVLFFPFSTFQCKPWGCTLFTESFSLGCKSVLASFIDASRCACVSLVWYFEFTNFITKKAGSHRYVVSKREINFALNDRNFGKVVTGTAFEKSIKSCPVAITGNFS